MLGYKVHNGMNDFQVGLNVDLIFQVFGHFVNGINVDYYN